MRAKLTLCQGLPASGKSSYCQAFKQRHGAHVVLSSDEVRGILGKGESDQSVSAQTFKFLETACELLLRQGRNVIVDATGTTRKARRAFVDLGLKYSANIRIAVFNASIETCKARNAARERKVPDEVIGRMAKNWEVPKVFDAFDKDGNPVPESGECHEVFFI